MRADRPESGWPWTRSGGIDVGQFQELFHSLVIEPAGIRLIRQLVAHSDADDGGSVIQCV